VAHERSQGLHGILEQWSDECPRACIQRLGVRFRGAHPCFVDDQCVEASAGGRLEMGRDETVADGHAQGLLAAGQGDKKGHEGGVGPSGVQTGGDGGADPARDALALQ